MNTRTAEHREKTAGQPFPDFTTQGSVGDVVCISSIDWDFIWQGHQEIMSTLAAQGNRVLFIENTGIRAVNWSDMPRLRHRLRNWWNSVRGFRQVRPNLYLYSPLALPFPYSRLAQWVNRLLMNRDLRQWMRIMNFTSPITWTFLPTPLAMDIVRTLNPKLLIYYCIDNFSVSSQAARKILRAERRMLGQADLVFVTSQQLFRYTSEINPNVHWFPFGVNIEQFEKIRNESMRPLPEEFNQIPSPRVGYVGGIHRWIDLDLLKQLALRRPDLQIVLVGPVQTDAGPLKGIPNIHWLGAKAHDQIPDYIRAFDVGLIPYRLTEYTDNVYPTKMNEYLAMGKPVVSTPLREIRFFNERQGDLVALGTNAEEFSRQIDKALSPRSDDPQRRIAVARENSWQVRIERMNDLIQAKIIERTASNERGWQKIFRDIVRRARRRMTAALAAAGICFSLLYYSPLPWWLAAPLKRADAPRSADAIVVFAGGVGESGQAEQGYEERVQRAVELFRAGYAARMIFSSGYTHFFREPEVMKALAVALGVPEQAILLETQATSTVQNVSGTVKLLNQHRWKSILLVSSPYHMRRASMVFTKQAPQIQVICTPVERSLFYSHRRPGASLGQMRGILHEILAIVYYRMKSWA